MQQLNVSLGELFRNEMKSLHVSFVNLACT
jgi:hypothetical protein